MTDRSIRLLLLCSVFVIATCGLIYELIAGTLASYLLGDSITQFSTVIGTYLFAMGIGSWISRYIERGLLAVFVQIELFIGLIGGCSAALMFLLFGHVHSFRLLLYGLVLVIGTLVGIEIPILIRILKDRLSFKDLVAKVFTFDYVGALFAAVLFPLVLVPHLGLVRSAFFFGALNVLVGLLTLWLLRDQIAWAAGHAGIGAAFLAVLGVGFVGADRILSWSEEGTYADPIIHARTTPYQRIILTRGGNDLRLYLNGNLQFSARDEYRYHEALVHPGLSRVASRKRVLVLGGGDGLAVREILRYPDVEQVTLVDLDPAMTQLFSTHEILVALNGGALQSPKVRVINHDAFTWIKEQNARHDEDWPTMGEKALWDFVVVDFPDPSNFSVGKLYTLAFYRELRRLLAPGAGVVIQSTSPYVARRSFWTIVQTLEAAGFQTEPYHIYVPSFGEWGYVLAAPTPLPEVAILPAGLRYLDPKTLPLLAQFPPDIARVPAEVNRLNNQILVRTFEEEWSRYVR